jgi:hypothetical protein
MKHESTVSNHELGVCVLLFPGSDLPQIELEKTMRMAKRIIGTRLPPTPVPQVCSRQLCPTGLVGWKWKRTNDQRRIEFPEADRF